MTEKRKSAQVPTFQQAEQEFAELKCHFESGKLTEADVKARLQDLMVQDEQGQWWVIGYESSQWYVRVGEEWIRRDRPGESPVVPAVETVAHAGRPLRETLWWPALLMSMGLVFSSQVSSSIFRSLFDCGCLGDPDYFECLRYNCPLTLVVFSSFFFGILAGLVIALIIKSFYATFTWKHVAIVAGGWGVLLGLSPFLVRL